MSVKDDLIAAKALIDTPEKWRQDSETLYAGCCAVIATNRVAGSMDEAKKRGIKSPDRADSLALPELLKHQQVNLTGALHVVAAVVPGLLESARAGRAPHLSLVASVAGWRGLPQGLAYGPTKAALINLAETLFLDLRPHGIGVSIVNPGFVDTPLTRQNDFAMPALLTPAQAADAMLRGWARGGFEVHFPRRFTCWLKLLRVLPYRWYFALVHRMTGL